MPFSFVHLNRTAFWCETSSSGDLAQVCTVARVGPDKSRCAWMRQRSGLSSDRNAFSFRKRQSVAKPGLLVTARAVRREACILLSWSEEFDILSRKSPLKTFEDSDPHVCATMVCGFSIGRLLRKATIGRDITKSSSFGRTTTYRADVLFRTRRLLFSHHSSSRHFDL